MRKILLVLLCFILVVTSSMGVFAYTYPDSFWAVNDKYAALINKTNKTRDDYRKIIEYGSQIVNIMENAPDGYEKNDIMVGRYNQIGLAYAALGEYENSADAFRNLLDSVGSYTEEFYDYIKGAEARILQYEPRITMYTDGGSPVYYDAKNEPRNGVLYGTCSNGGTRMNGKLARESMVLTYQEFGQSLLPYNTDIVKKAAASGCAVEFALNCPKEATDIRNVRKMNAYLEEISRMFSNYSNVPIYLRFAAEFDVWSNLATPQEFRDAFRYVSDYFHNRNSNVAMVWSPSQESNWYLDIDEYYPGDAYVDWVGMSLYAKNYFKGDKNQSEASEIIYKTGINSDPVLMVEDIVKTYGDRKPIMISESGVGHKVMTTGEDTTEFAIQRLQEQYCYLPMVYPQIKLIAYFDWYVDGGNEYDDFRLSNQAKVQQEYLELVKRPNFIQDNYNNSTGYCSRPIYNGVSLESVFELSLYAHSYGAKPKNVVYSIDGNYVGMASEMPYTAMIDASMFPGNHMLKAVVTFDNGETLTTESKVVIHGDVRNVTVEINNREISFDQEPIIYHDRTMVPMRKIFEELGAQVSWDSSTQTASGKKGDRTVKVSIGKTTMQVNSKEIQLDTAPIELSGRTLVPVRAIAEGLGCRVDWNERYNLVSITPPNFQWSDWVTSLPSDVDEDLFYIEEQEEYRYRTREKEYFTLDYKTWASNFVEENITYGNWSSWQDSYISANEDREVETRTQSSPKEYFYAHYCTGHISDAENRYYTNDYKFHSECDYHELGWFSEKLPYADEDHPTWGSIYYVNGDKYRCNNSCYRWYLMDTEGGEYTQYRSRDIYREYVYWEWGEWSRWSGWDDDEPYDSGRDIDIDERTVYRYKEKG